MLTLLNYISCLPKEFYTNIKNVLATDLDSDIHIAQLCQLFMEFFTIIKNVLTLDSDSYFP